MMKLTPEAAAAKGCLTHYFWWVVKLVQALALGISGFPSSKAKPALMSELGGDPKPEREPSCSMARFFDVAIPLGRVCHCHLDRSQLRDSPRRTCP